MRLMLSAVALLLSGHLHVFPQETRDFTFERTIEMEIDERDNTYSLEEQTRDTYTYLSERSCQTTSFYVYGHYFATIENLTGELDGSGLPQSAFSFEKDNDDSFISSSVLHTIRFPKSVRPGQTASYRYRKKYLGIEYAPILYLPNIDYTKKWHLVIRHPEEVRVDFEIVSARQAHPFTIKRDDDDRTELIFENVPYSAELPYFAFNNNHSFVQVKLSKNGKPLNPTSVEGFAGWYRGLFDQDPVLQPQHAGLLDQQINAAQSVHAKIKLLHDFVRSTIRYIAQNDSMGAIVPRNPGLVLDRKYGDCKDRAYLISTLARRYGIEVDMVTLSTDPVPEFSGAGISQYNHVICSFKNTDGTRVFFDPTDRYSPYGSLPESDIGADALVLNGAEPRRTVIAAPTTRPSLEIDISGSIAELKNAKARVILRNSLYSRGQYAQKELSGIDRQNYLERQMNSPLQKISIQDPVFESESDTSITYTADVDLSAFIISSETKKYILQNVFTPTDATVLEREKDTFSLFLPSRYNAIVTLDLATEGYAAENTTTGIGDGKPVKFTTAMSPGQRTMIRYEISQQEKFLKGEKKAAYLAFCKYYFKNKKNMFVLSKREK